MLCPHCKIDLQKINLGKISAIKQPKDYCDYVEVNICNSCYGIWLDNIGILKLVETDRNSLKLIENKEETDRNGQS